MKASTGAAYSLWIDRLDARQSRVELVAVSAEIKRDPLMNAYRADLEEHARKRGGEFGAR